MTKPDFFSQNMALPHIVAITEPCFLETGNDDVTLFYERGLYAFSSFKKARRFTTLINADKTDPVAFRFSSNITQEENDDD